MNSPKSIIYIPTLTLKFTEKTMSPHMQKYVYYQYKEVIQKEQLKVDGIILHNVLIDVVNFLKTNMSLPHVACATTKQQLQQMFCEIKVGDVNRNHGFDCRTIIGSHSMHSICSMSHRNNVLLQVKDFSAYVAIVLMEHQVFVCP